MELHLEKKICWDNYSAGRHGSCSDTVALWSFPLPTSSSEAGQGTDYKYEWIR